MRLYVGVMVLSGYGSVGLGRWRLGVVTYQAISGKARWHPEIILVQAARVWRLRAYPDRVISSEFYASSRGSVALLQRERIQRMGTSGVVYTLQREVKFYDLRKINKSESIPQGCFHRSRTKVGGSKTIRYRRSLNHKLCRPGIGDRRFSSEFLKKKPCYQG